MRTIGEYIKDARKEKRYTYAALEEGTAIKKEFILALENERWEDLPDYAVVSGFVRKIAKSLGLEESVVLALLRRDYPRVEELVNPKPDVGNKLVWSPKFTFIAGAAVVVLIVVGYLTFQYIDFLGNPSLSLSEPVESEVVGNSVKVLGTTDTDATIMVNNQPVVVGADGKFVAEIEVTPGTKSIEVVAKSRSGKETAVTRKIEVSLD